MKKTKIIALCLFVCFLCLWLPSLIKCEVLSIKHIDEFTEICPQEFDQYDSIKVTSYSEHKAEIYALHSDKEYANTYLFTRNSEQDQWNDAGWNTVWSVHGNADGLLWPYWWHICYSTQGIVPVIIFFIAFAILIKNAVKSGKRCEENA